MKKMYFPLVIGMFLAIPCAAEVIIVEANGTGDYLTIQAAINATINGDVVVLGDGTYTGNGNRDIDFLGKAITVRSNNGPEDCIINCQGSGPNYRRRGFDFHSGEDSNSIVDGLTIKNGVHDLGGAIYCHGSSPTIRNCIFVNNRKFGNYSPAGGAICCTGSNSMIIDCIFLGNISEHAAGAIDLYGSGCTVTIINSVFIGNSTAIAPLIGNGGAIRCWRSKPRIINCTIVGNTSSDLGGGIYSTMPWGGPTTILNCIVWANSDKRGMGQSSQINGNGLVVNYSCIQGLSGGFGGMGNIGGDPNFVDMDGPDNILGTKDDILRLSDGSPCIDAGDNTSVPTDNTDIDDDRNTTELIPWDIDGNLRFLDDPDTIDTGNGAPPIPIVDIGAYEHDGRSILGDCEPDGDVDMRDFAVFALAWQSTFNEINWNPVCDISEPNDNVIDELDLAIFCENWLAGATP